MTFCCLQTLRLSSPASPGTGDLGPKGHGWVSQARCPPYRGSKGTRPGLAAEGHTPNWTCKLAPGRVLAAPVFLICIVSFNPQDLRSLCFSSLSSSAAQLFSSHCRLLRRTRWLCLPLTLPVPGFMENRELVFITLSCQLC